MIKNLTWRFDKLIQTVDAFLESVVLLLTVVQACFKTVFQF